MVRLRALMNLNDWVAVAGIRAWSAAAFALGFRTVARGCAKHNQQNCGAHHGHIVVNGLGIPVCGA
jgi:hypothetical protein